MTTRNDLLDEVDRLVYIAWGVDITGRTVAWADGGAVIQREPPTSSLPAVDSAEWWEAAAPVRVAALVLLSKEHLIAQRELADRMKAASLAIGEEWQRHRDLIRRRRAAIGHALRCDGTCREQCGGPARAVELTWHHASDRWAEEVP